MTEDYHPIGALILSPADLRVITDALAGICTAQPEPRATEDRERVGKAVIRLYSAGMTDLDLLTDAAKIMAATQRLGRDTAYQAVA